MRLRADEILLILDALREKYGPGYAQDAAVARLQAKLSIALELARRVEEQKEAGEP